MFHTDALFNGVSQYDREVDIINQLEKALADGKRVVHVSGSWQTYRGRAEIAASLAARKARLAA